MSVEKRVNGDGSVVWRTRWRDGGRNRARTFSNRRDALDWEAECRRLARAGTLALLDAGQESLDDYVENEWVTSYGMTLAEKTRRHYADLYGRHLGPYLGSMRLRDVTPEVIARWQAQRLVSGAGPVAVRHALDLLSSILQRAVEAQRLPTNPARAVRRANRPRRKEVRPLAPSIVERMRDASSHRDATLISVLAYAGLRPQEALALRWEDVRDNTLLIHRAVSLGVEVDTKTRQHRTVRLLPSLRSDLVGWRLASASAQDDDLLFPSHAGSYWTTYAYQSWRRRAFRRAVEAAGLAQARPYDLRHSFASLLLHEGRSAIYVARQLGHDARLTLTTYGHVIDELEEAPSLPAEEAIRAAREVSGTRLVPATVAATEAR